MNVDIYVALDGISLKLLQIPANEIRRFGSQRPNAFLRYVLFTICGKTGDLFVDDADSQPMLVDYDSNEIREKYIYRYDSTETTHAFIDLKGLNDRLTSTAVTPRRLNLRADLEKRDGRCVVTGGDFRGCDAAHIIPHSQGDEYISTISSLRSRVYSEQTAIDEIDSLKNVLLLRKDLHLFFGSGYIGFVTLPNFAMTCNDLPFVPGPFANPDPTNPTKRVVFVQFVPLDDNTRSYATGRNARFSVGEQNVTLPSPLLLDFHFGLSFYKNWHVPEADDYLRQFRKDHYENIANSKTPTKDLDPDSDDGSSSSEGSEHDPSYRPAGEGRTDPSMDQSMDDVLYLSMALQGLTPKVMAEMEQRRQEVEQLKSQQKVLDWMEASPPDSAESFPEITQ